MKLSTEKRKGRPQEGEDIRFVKPDGTLLPHEIELWDSIKESADIWVLMDSVRGDASNLRIKMLWGSPDPVNIGSGGAVFDSALGFQGVWHLGWRGESMRANSVPGGIGARTVNFPGGGTKVGQIGLADSLEGDATGAYFDLGDGYADFSAGFTFSIWARPAQASRDTRLLDFGSSSQDGLVLRRSGIGQDLSEWIPDSFRRPGIEPPAGRPPQ